MLSASLLAPASLACIWYGGLAWDLLLGAGVMLLAQEWARLGRADRAAPMAVLILALLAAEWLTVGGQLTAAVTALAAGAALLLLLSRGVLAAAGAPYIGAALIALAALRADPGAGRGDVLFLVFVVWASDIGAYLAGRLVGGPKLAPLVSPGKTWSGAAGGLLAALLVGFGAALAGGGDPLRAASVAAVLGVMSQAGDLFESWIKRLAGVKDAGRLIPGHGGLLDRLDGLIAAAPAAALLALISGRGVFLWR